MVTWRTDFLTKRHCIIILLSESFVGMLPSFIQCNAPRRKNVALWRCFLKNFSTASPPVFLAQLPQKHLGSTARPFRSGAAGVFGECRKSQAATTVKYVVQSNIRCCGSPFQAVAARECYKESLQLFEQLEAVRRICSSAPGRFGQLREEYLSCMIW